MPDVNQSTPPLSGGEYATARGLAVVSDEPYPVKTFALSELTRNEVINPQIARIDELRADVDALELTQVGAGVAFATLALLNANLNFAADTKAEVWADGTPANNGVYKKVGASGAGSWTRIADLGVTALATRATKVEANERITALASGSSTAAAIVATTVDSRNLTAYENYREYDVKMDSAYVGAASNVTLKIDNGPVMGVYDYLNGTIDPSSLVAGAWVRFRYVPNFGGLFQVVERKRTREIVRCASGGGTANAVTANSTFGGEGTYSIDKVYSVVLSLDPTVQTPNLSIDGGASIGIFDSEANLLPLGYLRKFRRYDLRYNDTFNCWTVIADIPTAGSADSYRGLQAAEAACATVRTLYRQVNAAPATPTVHYHNQFNSQADADHFDIAHGSLDSSSSPTYNNLQYNAADGGYALADADINGGLWSDHNHIWPGPGMLNLLAVGNTVANGGSIPNISDIRNAKVTLRLRAVNLLLPRFTRLAFHFQVNDVAVGSGGTGKGLNYIYTGKLLDDALGFGGEGLGFPHMRDTALTNASPVTIVIDCAPMDAFWRCIFTSVGRKDTYAAAPVERAMQQALLNFQIVALHPQQDSPTSMPLERISGDLQLHEFKIEKP